MPVGPEHAAKARTSLLLLAALRSTDRELPTAIIWAAEVGREALLRCWAPRSSMWAPARVVYACAA